MGDKRKDYELIIEAIDSKTKIKCDLCRTKYILQWWWFYIYGDNYINIIWLLWIL